MIYCDLNHSFELTAQRLIKNQKLKPWPNPLPLLEWFCQGLNKPAGKGNSCRISYCFASYSGVRWSCPMPRYKHQALHGSYSPPMTFLFQAQDLLMLCCSTRMWDLQWLLSISAALPPPKPCKAFQAWAIFKIHLRSGWTQHVTFSFWHHQMPGPATPPDETAFLSRVSLCISAGGDPRIFLQCK